MYNSTLAELQVLFTPFNNEMNNHLNSLEGLPEVIESNDNAHLAFVLRGYDGSSLFPETKDFVVRLSK